MTKAILAAALLLSALPALADPPPTPPNVLGAAKTIQFTATFYKDEHPSAFFATGKNGNASLVSEAVLVQPNKAYVMDTNAQTKAISIIYASDGKNQTEYRASRSRYTKSDAPAQIADMDSQTLALSTLTDFFAQSAFGKFKDLGAVGVRGTERDHAYLLPLGTQDGKETDEVIVVDHKTGLPMHISIQTDMSFPNEMNNGTHLERRETERIVFSDWKLNAPIDDSKFAYTPPADAKLYVAPQILANGTAAPDFTVQDKDGHSVKLSDYKGKTVVLDFWATWCGPCQSSLPHTTAMAKKYADRNVTVLAVNVWDTPAAFQAWLPKHPEYAPLHFAIDPSADQSKSVASALYGVSGIPTQYVIGPDGKIIKSIVGYETGDTQLEDTLKTTASGTGN